MCTVSWRRERGGYDLFFNRDELHTRAPESPPERGERNGVAFLAPRDGARGGTWLLVNERGVTVCLLNDYASARQIVVAASASESTVPPLAGARGYALSRGEIVLACAGATSPDDAIASVRAQPLARIAPFHLLVLAPDAEPRLLHWNGQALNERVGGEVSPPFSSSSFATAEVIAARVRRFAAYAREPAAPTPDELNAYHRQHDARAGAHSVLMRRTDAATRSICHVQVNAARVRLDYTAVAWSAGGPVLGEPVRGVLARAEVPLLPKRATAEQAG
jgi:hypothetical protein